MVACLLFFCWLCVARCLLFVVARVLFVVCCLWCVARLCVKCCYHCCCVVVC